MLLIDAEAVIGKGCADRQDDRDGRASDLQDRACAVTTGEVPGKRGGETLFSEDPF